ncbi:MAG TPA: lysozyme [Blastocatellia bacterium]|jgi:lysozyme|nr:lysozyme [Blastocatellia bacterium]
MAETSDNETKATTLRISPKGLDLIKRFEGLRLEVYLDTVGIKTAGYGTTGHGVAEMTVGAPITQAQADAWIAEDARAFESAVNAFVKVPLNQNQFDALVSFVYNLGANALKSSTLLRLLNVGAAEAAAEEFLKWTKAGGRRLPGLVKRRSAERELFLSAVKGEHHG